jgi:hypothetical protein
LAPSSFSSPFHHLTLHHPSLHASFEASLFVSLKTQIASSEILSTFSKALCYSFYVLLFNNGINHPLTINPMAASAAPYAFFLKFLALFFSKLDLRISRSHLHPRAPPLCSWCLPLSSAVRTSAIQPPCVGA